MLMQAKSMMANPQKRKYEDMNVSEMSVSSVATVHGVLMTEVRCFCLECFRRRISSAAMPIY